MTASIDEVFSAQQGARSFLQETGFGLSGEQETKTKRALRFIASQAVSRA